jgi:hypothetical protein
VTISQADAAIESDPAHQPAVRKLLPASSRLPNALLWLVPVVDKPVQDVANMTPSPMAGFESMLVAEVDTVDRLAVDIELQLIRGTVPDPHRAGSPISLPMRKDLFAQVAGTIDPIHDVEWAAFAANLLADPFGQPTP